MSALPIAHPIVNLALQGGGSHGAFTWGVLDALLEDGRVELEGISGTSAGAMNAVALVHGFAQAQGKVKADRRELARQSLADFWEGIVSMGAMSEAQRAPFDMLLGGFGGEHTAAGLWANQLTSAVTDFWSSALSQSMSPYQNNPLDINPLKGFLERQIDFDAIARLKTIKVFVVATRVSTGKAEVFSGKQLTAAAVMASACLPMLFKAVEIDGDHYWDGGFSGNPAIHPLIYNCTSRDVILVQINPIERDKLPTTASEIMDRMNEITFNAGLIAEMRAIDFVKRLIAQGKLDPAHYKDLLLHRIDGGELLENYSVASKVSTKASMIHALRDLGRDCAKAWLTQNFAALGLACTVNIEHDYLDDLRAPMKRGR
ncbi:MAG: patatin-like phospholipase family protein [Burkholderiaceae bacterium]|nr:patatin-like phospholipase family protein [Burkholderiaceae bacterium]